MSIARVWWSYCLTIKSLASVIKTKPVSIWFLMIKSSVMNFCSVHLQRQNVLLHVQNLQMIVSCIFLLCTSCMFTVPQRTVSGSPQQVEGFQDVPQGLPLWGFLLCQYQVHVSSSCQCSCCECTPCFQQTLVFASYLLFPNCKCFTQKAPLFFLLSKLHVLQGLLMYL